MSSSETGHAVVLSNREIEEKPAKEMASEFCGLSDLQAALPFDRSGIQSLRQRERSNTLHTAESLTVQVSVPRLFLGWAR